MAQVGAQNILIELHTPVRLCSDRTEQNAEPAGGLRERCVQWWPLVSSFCGGALGDDESTGGHADEGRKRCLIPCDGAIDGSPSHGNDASLVKLEVEEAPRVLQDHRRIGTKPPDSPQEPRHAKLLQITARLQIALQPLLEAHDGLEPAGYSIEQLLCRSALRQEDHRDAVECGLAPKGSAQSEAVETWHLHGGQN